MEQLAKKILIIKRSEEYAYDMGFDCAINGANDTNCNFSIFLSPQNTKAWERGKVAGEEHKKAMLKPYYETELGKLYHGDCFEIMPKLNPVGLILCDLPYGITASSWDKEFQLDKLWDAYKKIISESAAIILTGSQPFSSKLVMSNLEMFKHEWIWIKNRLTGFPSAKYKPMGAHEHILIFGNGKVTYNPQKTKGHNPTNSAHGQPKHRVYHGKFNIRQYKGGDTTRYPISVQNFDCERGYHPNQKPVSMFMYFIVTYSEDENIVLDNCIGSGTTAVACERLNRKWIGIEIEERYCEISAKRIEKERQQLKLFK